MKQNHRAAKFIVTAAIVAVAMARSMPVIYRVEVRGITADKVTINPLMFTSMPILLREVDGVRELSLIEYLTKESHPTQGLYERRFRHAVTLTFDEEEHSSCLIVKSQSPEVSLALTDAVLHELQEHDAKVPTLTTNKPIRALTMALSALFGGIVAAALHIRVIK